MSKPTVLVVDDDKDLLQLITIRLEANGFNVEPVSTAEDALTRIALARPQAVLTSRFRTSALHALQHRFSQGAAYNCPSSDSSSFSGEIVSRTSSRNHSQ